MGDIKKLLIVDDSEIDRAVLRSILEDEYEVSEVDNGYSALELILQKKEAIDALLLDVSMPLLDGLSVLRLLRESSSQLPVFMITSEATKDNVEEAFQYHIAEFIKKPFNREDILTRVRSRLGMIAKIVFSNEEMEETRKYATDLTRLYNGYLRTAGKNAGWDERRACFMAMLLKRYHAVGTATEHDRFRLEMLCKAAYLCNIGRMLLPEAPGGREEEEVRDIPIEHTGMGADVIRLNYSQNCSWFVKSCAEICANHHERYDGDGRPNGLRGNSISVYAQMCGLLEEFDELFYQYKKHSEMQFDLVFNQLKRDAGLVSGEVFSLLADSKHEIIKYYAENYIE